MSRAWNGNCGRQLEVLRGIHGLQQREVADRVGVTDRAYRKWKKGETEPSPINKADLVEVLGGRDDPCWDDPRFRELALCLGARAPEQFPESSILQESVNDVGTHAATTPATSSNPRDGRRHLGWIVAAILAAAVVAILLVNRMRENPLIDVVPSSSGYWKLVFVRGERTQPARTGRTTSSTTTTPA